MRAAAGVPDLPVKIDGVARWRATSDVARRFAHGRMFLAGDAAHLMPPNGGFGGNTGIHDAHNLAWKLAYVLKGLAGPRAARHLRPGATADRKFTVEQAYTRYVTRTAPYLGATDFQPLADDFNIELGHMYHSPAIVSDEDDSDTVHADPHQTRGRPGTRAPHLWLAHAGTADLDARSIWDRFVLLAAPHGKAWCAAAAAPPQRFPGLPRRSRIWSRPGFEDPAGEFAQAYRPRAGRRGAGASGWLRCLAWHEPGQRSASCAGACIGHRFDEDCSRTWQQRTLADTPGFRYVSSSRQECRALAHTCGGWLYPRGSGRHRHCRSRPRGPKAWRPRLRCWRISPRARFSHGRP